MRKNAIVNRRVGSDHEMKEVLERLLKDSRCDYVFTNPQDPTKPLGLGCWKNRWAKYARRSRLTPMPVCTLFVTPF